MAPRRKLAPLPRVTSKTITVGALLRKIQRLILAESRRLRMATYVSVFQGKKITTTSDVISRPACGTVACLAGWGAILLRPDVVSGRDLNFNADDAMEYAFGVDDSDGGRNVCGLFASRPVGAFGETGWTLPPAGTTAHAAVIAKRIDTYLSQHPEIVNRKIIVADVQKALRA